MKPYVRGVALVLVALIVATGTASRAAQDARDQQEQPRFRSGANLVRIDAYVSQNGEPVGDLTLDDFEVLEDGVRQRLESFQVIRPRGPAPEATRIEPNTVAESRAIAASADARVFVLFLDVWHVHLEGSYRAQGPVTNLLEGVIGRDDLIGVMHPEMSAANLTLARRTTTIDGIMHDNWFWGERQRMVTSDPRELEIQMCYPDTPKSKTEGIAQEMIDRRRERKTLDAIADLIIHLEGIREERKFVVLLSEGWRLPRRDQRLARTIDDYVPRTDPISIGPDGRLTTAARMGQQSYDACERERQQLANEDMELDFRLLLQRANRANVSFYTVDPRGLSVFDEDLSLRRATHITADHAMLTARQDSLRELAVATDGLAVVNTSDVSGAMRRMLADVSMYYLLGYYSTNTKLDGKFRKLSVRVKRPGVDVRARPGYLAPTEAELAAATATTASAARTSDMAPVLRRAVESLTTLRGTAPVRVQTSATTGHVWIATELDASTAKNPEWQQGGRGRIVIEREKGGGAPIEREIKIEPGQRSVQIVESAAPSFAAGRYLVRLSLTPAGGSLPLQTTTDVVVPEAGMLLSPAGIVLRRGPATGLQYLVTADGRFQRTERLRFEVPVSVPGATLAARILNRNTQALSVPVTVTERSDDGLQIRLVQAEVMLAPLAQGEYVLEVTAEKDGKKETAAFAFRVVS
jgi:VWFA-related protein